MKTLLIPIAVVFISGCVRESQCELRFSDNSSACDEPVMADDLEGKWCDPRPAHLLCLEVYGPPGAKAYAWQGSDCAETGILYGGLEFEAFRNRNGVEHCFSPESMDLYSASADWSKIGLVFYIDGQSEPIPLSYIRSQQ